MAARFVLPAPAASIRRALALLAAASADSRLKGPSDGSTPLHWPIALRAARAHLEHALAHLPCPDCGSTEEGHATPCGGRRVESGPHRSAVAPDMLTTIDA